MLRAVRALHLALLLAASLLCAAGCDSRDATAQRQADPPVQVSPAPAGKPAAARGNVRRKERPLPAFSGRTLGGDHLSVSSLLGKRLLLFFFNPEVPSAISATAAVTAIAPLQRDQNFRIVAVAVGSSRDRALAFVREQRIGFDVIDDSNGEISQRLGLRSPVSILGVDGEGYVVFGFSRLPDDTTAVEGYLRTALRLPAAENRDDALAPGSGRHPAAPDFEAEVLDRDQPVSLSDYAGRPLVLIFFLHTCPHCHEALKSLKTIVSDLPEGKRPAVIGVEVSGRTAPVRSMVREFALDFVTVAFDRNGKLRDLYGVHGGVPEIFLIDAGGRIAARVQGWRGDTDPPLMRMRLAKLTGAPVPMLLRTRGYSGNEVCGVCHEMEADTWQFTAHAQAFDTLVRHGADRDPECVSCHVVGYDQPGGYTIEAPKAYLEDVGCESCHGRGGPHLSKGFVENVDYAPVCGTCHDTKHSLGFDYATFRPAISHVENRHLTTLPAQERRALLAKRGRPGGELLANTGYVGSDACASCHASEYATWLASAHARWLTSLESKHEADSADCLRCHTTAFGKQGGFADSGDLVSFAATNPDLARVGCESCHGPGADHIDVNAPKTGTIISLGDKCDSCVILQVCGTCHDSKNDPEFEFSVQEKIDRQRHGTLRPGSGRATDPSAGAFHRASGAYEGTELDVARLAAHAFALHSAHD